MVVVPVVVVAAVVVIIAVEFEENENAWTRKKLTLISQRRSKGQNILKGNMTNLDIHEDRKLKRENVRSGKKEK